MKSIKILFVLLSLIAVSALTVAAQEEKVATERNKKSDAKTVKKENDQSKRQYLVGAKGGCYYLTENGKKSYVDKKFCEGAADSTGDGKRDAAAVNTSDSTESGKNRIENRTTDTEN